MRSGKVGKESEDSHAFQGRSGWSGLFSCRWVDCLRALVDNQKKRREPPWKASRKKTVMQTRASQERQDAAHGGGLWKRKEGFGCGFPGFNTQLLQGSVLLVVMQGASRELHGPVGRSGNRSIGRLHPMELVSSDCSKQRTQLKGTKYVK
jgi:hypothetical protein